MFTIKTFVYNPLLMPYDDRKVTKSPDTYLIPIEDMATIEQIKHLLDPDYMAGVIYLAYNNQVIFDVGMICEVEQLWGLSLNMIEEYLIIRNGKTGFPGDPGDISIKKVSENCLNLHLWIGESYDYLLPEKEFIRAWLHGAEYFYK